jgi:hypothetical protein
MSASIAGLMLTTEAMIAEDARAIFHFPPSIL